MLRKIKLNLTDQEYERLYPSGSAPCKFYGTAKLHKISINDGVDKLPIRPIISNIGTPNYQLEEYLAKLLSPLADSEYTVTSTKDFIKKIKNVKVLDGHQLISIDVKSLFTHVPLQKTIDIILKQIYENKEINTSISKKDMKDMLILCTKNVHFSMNGDIYLQIDGVAMGSPLGTVLAGICMVDLERSLVPKLSNYIKFWKQFVDDTITFANIEAIDHILTVLNSFDPNIQFTYEAEENSKLPFLDALLCCKDNKLVCSIYRKSTNNDIYMNWHSFVPKTWKMGTLKSLIETAILICSTEELLNEELKHLEKVFCEKNYFPK